MICLIATCLRRRPRRWRELLPTFIAVLSLGARWRGERWGLLLGTGRNVTRDLAGGRTGTSVEGQSRITGVLSRVILDVVDEIPAFHKVPAQILDHRTAQADGDVRPPHAGSDFAVQLILFPVDDVLEVKHPRVIVVLSWEHNLVEIAWMHVGDRMLVGVPASIAQIQTSHEGDFAIDHAQLLVMRPVQDRLIAHTVQSLERITGECGNVGCIQRQVLQRIRDRGLQFFGIRQMVWMAEYRNIRMEIL